MKDEINYSEMLFNRDERLLDYITNLQKENERLTQGVTLLTNKLIDMTKEKEDYKSRNEKAIECINYYATEDDDFNKLYNVEEQELLEILGDKE